MSRERYLIGEGKGRGCRYGWINRDGQIKISPRYSENQFPYFVEYGGYVATGRRYGVLDADGREITPPVFHWLLPYSDGMAVAAGCLNGCRVGGQGFIDVKGEWVIEPQFLELWPFEAGRALTSAKNRKDLYGFIDRDGIVQIDFRFEQVTQFNEGFALVREPGSKWLFIDESGAPVTSPQYDAGSGFFDGSAAVVIGGQNYLVSKRFTLQKLPSHRIVGHFREGLAAFCTREGRWGFLDTKGQAVVPAEWDFVNGFYEGRSVAVRAGACCYIDRFGEQAFPTWFRHGRDFHCGLAQVSFREGRRNMCGYINANGKMVWSGPAF